MLLYRLLLTIALLPIFTAFFLRAVRGRESWADFRERMGGGPAAPGPWVHAASVGEANSARGLVTALVAGGPVTLTCNTVNARDTVRGWGLDGLTPRLAPLDQRLCLFRFLRRAKPCLYVGVENEIWPNRFALLARRGIPRVLISARLSERSAERWSRWGVVVGPHLAGLSLVVPQDASSAERFADLGVAEASLADPMTLKASVSLASPPETALRAAWPYARELTCLAASTHAPEERIVLEAFTEARKERPELRLILAIRHPARGDEVAALLSKTPFRVARRSTGDAVTEETDILLADTLGEMALWYASASICWVGGSLSDRGGHTPYEPASFGCALLHGPDTSNFAEAYAALDTAGGALEVRNAAELGRALASLTPDAAAELARAAQIALTPVTPDRIAALAAELRALAQTSRTAPKG
ncbi:3-deoxy-D-manno-octulosonic acid transferase [Tropicimonas sp. IMCC34011]|uniref:3-deoxy-D-manno-octulosonic acid transferase n=1 Tax=Tropicimonas sp. IMCC34011 TaxID=2248759 RepID=UPI000E223012|nr:glycosyltransferase N-terminal domain-containing protein [Tropicimonas sp. IMCC34011]